MKSQKPHSGDVLTSPDEVLVASQDGVAVHEDHNKTQWVSGTLSLTTHYLVYHDGKGERDSKVLKVPLEQLVGKKPTVEKGFLFSSDKIHVYLPSGAHMKLSFKKGGCAGFFASLNQTLDRALWKAKTEMHSSPPKPEPASSGLQRLGIAGIMEDSKERSKMSETFTDIEDVMHKASFLVENISRLKRNASSGIGPAVDSTAIESIEATLGLGSMVQKSGSDRARFHASLAVELHAWMTHEKNAHLFGRMHLVPLVELFSLYNKARSGNLISPQDLLEACRCMESAVPKAVYKLETLSSGRMALLRKNSGVLLAQVAPVLGPRFIGSHENRISESGYWDTDLKHSLPTVRAFPTREKLRFVNEAKAASLFQVTMLDARDILMFLEQRGYLCRDDVGFGKSATDLMLLSGEKVEEVWTAVEQTLSIHRLDQWPVEQIQTLRERVVAHLGALASRKRQRSGEDSGTAVEEATDKKISELDALLARMQSFLRRKCPFGSLKEPTLPPGQASDVCAGDRIPSSTAPPIYSVDSFLYLEQDIDELVEEGKISREYCKCCGSTDIGLTEFITHSFNQDQLVYLTCFLLPELVHRGKEAPPGKTFTCRSILDVGSRLGVVLWATYFAAKCGLLPLGVEEVVGVEVDNFFCELQQEVGRRFCSRQVLLPVEEGQKPSKSPPHLTCRVVGSDCFEGDGKVELQKAEVIILHNVFEYFSDGPSGHFRCWEQLRGIVHRSGQILICFPSLEETLEGIQRHGVQMTTPTTNSEEEGLSVAQQWINSYVEPLDVSDVAQKYFEYRHRGADLSSMTAQRDDECHSCSENDDIPELLEMVLNMSVYRVK